MTLIIKALPLFLLNGYFLAGSCDAQRISNIRHEQFGDKIIIKYDIIGATSNQLFAIKAFCNYNGKAISISKTENRNWEMVKGGDDRQIVWNVLDEVDELVDPKITFTIIAEGFESKTDISPNQDQIGGRGLTTPNKKSLVYADLTSQTDTYLEEVYNIVTQFRNFGERAFESQAELKRLQYQIDKTNSAYNKILQNRRTFEQAVRELWGSELLNCQTETFFRRSLEQMHRTLLLPLNETIIKINKLNLNQLSKSEKMKFIERLKLEIEIRTSQLNEEINSIKGDAKGLYAELKQ